MSLTTGTTAAVSETTQGLYRIVDGDQPGTRDLFVIDVHTRNQVAIQALIEACVRIVKEHDPDEYNATDLAERLDKYELILVEPVTIDELW